MGSRDTTIITAIGSTPLVRIETESPGTILAKLEYLNPGGSIKDRSARHMIQHAEQAGLLAPGGTIIDASSGNQGIATAMIGTARGYNVIIAVPEKISREKLETIQSYGAQVIVCPATRYISDPENYHSIAKRLAHETPNSFMPNQYYNIENARAHYLSLGPEIWQQTNGKVTHFFAGAGTGGTISGVGKYLKEQNPTIKIIAVDSAHSFRATKGNPKPYSLEGIGIDFDTPVLDYSVIDEILTVHDEEAIHMLKFLAKHHGLLTGPSSGAVAWAVRKYAKTLKEGDLAVMIFGDSGRAYLSKGFYK